eukprot:TRINITY_DN32532_c0_g1_i1.p1 TRINITY_DN32532_c0_g1~~TRINITY_DN32532_c0_g1_i1.p1  ORF type:complete len:511 (-),score=73.15 TRINITY_DN32532_c0_g1_i1:25-1557(-)
MNRQESPTTIQTAKFEIYCSKTFYGETVAVCGAGPVLGGWDPCKSLRLITNSSIFPAWCSEEPVHLEVGTEYKFIILTFNNTVAWETPAMTNRTLPLDMPSGSCVFVAAHIERAEDVNAEFVTTSVRAFTFGKADMTLSELRDIFDKVDAQRNGKFTSQDLVRAIRGSTEIAFFFGLPQSAERDDFVDTIFQAIDVAGSNEVTWQDFHRFYSSFTPVLPSFENVLIDDANMLASTHNVKFEICCRHTYWGETLAVCGASPLLGEWNPKKALRLTTSPGMFPKWCSEVVNIDQGTAYKFVILQHDGNVWWETQKNRMLPQNIPSGSCVLVAAHFERPGVVFEARFEIRSFNSFKFGKPGMASSELRAVWDKIDVQRKGKVNRRDLIKAIRGSSEIASFFGLPQEFQQEDASRANFEAMFQAMDLAGSREVTWLDFHTLYVGFAPIIADKKAALIDSLRARTPAVPCIRAELDCRVNKARSRRFQRPRISNPISRYGSKAKQQSSRAECTIS